MDQLILLELKLLLHLGMQDLQFRGFIGFLDQNIIDDIQYDQTDKQNFMKGDQLEILNSNKDIYDEMNHTICISSYELSNLSLQEKQCILVSRTGNPSYNSFAAEIIFHAAITERIKSPSYIYNSAKKADMGVDEEKDEISDDSYINYDGVLVKQQREIFGDK